MSRPPATLTSPTHALGVVMILVQAALAVQMLLGVGSTRALGDLLGNQAAAVFVPLLMFTAAAGSLYAVYCVARSRHLTAQDQRDALRLELTCKAALAFTTLLYAAALTIHYNGWSAAPNINTYVWGTAAGFAGRVWQIRRDLRTVARVEAAGVLADPTPLGEPDAPRR